MDKYRQNKNNCFGDIAPLRNYDESAQTGQEKEKPSVKYSSSVKAYHIDSSDWEAQREIHLRWNCMLFLLFLTSEHD